MKDDDDETKFSFVVCHDVGGFLVACRAVKGITTSNPLKDYTRSDRTSQVRCCVSGTEAVAARFIFQRRS